MRPQAARVRGHQLAAVEDFHGLRGDPRLDFRRSNWNGTE